MKRRTRWGVCLFCLGVIVGGILFSDSQPRFVLTAPKCKECLSPTAMLGLVGSLVVQRGPGLIPNSVIETELTLGFEHPFPTFEKHYVFVPKRDIKDVADLSKGDEAHVQDMFAAMAMVVRSEDVSNYMIWTNGPGRQAVEYLHFHLGGE